VSAGNHKKKRNQSPYPFIGRCIYCGNTELKELSDEHCVPESLNGIFKLLKASCGRCRDMTSAFEGNITHHALGKLRAAMQFKGKSKRKKTRATSYAVEVKNEGEAKLVDMPVEAIIGLMPALDVGVPTYLADKFFSDISDVPTGLKGVAGFGVFRSREKTRAFLDGIGAESISAKRNMDVFEFARLLAKIAYCIAIANLYEYKIGTFDDIEEAHVLPLIRGDVSDPWRFVGKAAPIFTEENPDTSPHRIATTVKEGEILAHIQLFAPWRGPEYLVAVGRASERLRERLRTEGDPDV
jgi:hypothetical protein